MSFRKIPTEVYPLVGAVGVGCGLAGFCMAWNLKNNTDINVSKRGYSWENINPSTHKPHLPFLAGEKSNQKIDEFRSKHPEIVNQASFKQ